jgi:protease I
MSLAGKKIAVLVEDGYEELELWYPYYRLMEEGADVVLAGHERKTYTSKHGYPCDADVKVSELGVSDVDAVVIPGGVAGPDRMRRHSEVIDFVRRMGEDDRLVAAICHAAWIPISAGLAKGRLITSFFSVKDDCVNAGATWVDKEVVVDGNLITSRHPDDLPDFCRAIIRSLTR